MNDEPDFIAEMDQQRENVKNFAPLLGDYFKALLEQTFDRREALKLVRDFQAEMFENSRNDE